MHSGHDNDKDALARAKALWNSKIDSSKSARQKRRRKVYRLQDGRSLNASGRTELFNFRASPEIRDLLKKHVGRGKISLWLEAAIVAKLMANGVKVGQAILDKLAEDIAKESTR
jgi:hypothetical protein